jgi:hypothetical protein
MYRILKYVAGFFFGLDSVVLIEGSILDPCNGMSDKFMYNYGEGPLSSSGVVSN